MPYKDKQRKLEYDREWRKRAEKNRLCKRCGIKLIEGEGRYCVTCCDPRVRVWAIR